MQGRQGSTLMEVLVAIFVMGIGLLAIMAMFPLAAVSMARSIRDDRVAHGAANARAIAIAKAIRFDTTYVTPFFTNPGTALSNLNAVTLKPNPFANAGPTSISWPLFVDPVGWSTYNQAGQYSVAGNLSSINASLPRTTLGFLSTGNAQSLLTWCTMVDDIAFDTNGAPAPLTVGGTTTFARNASPSISYAWLLRRPKTGVQSVVDMSIVVYNQRSLALGGVQTSARELQYIVLPNNPNYPNPPNPTNLVTIIWGAGVPAPQIFDGGWVLDMTPNPVANSTTFTPGNAKFYRVVSVGDMNTGQPVAGLTGTYSTMALELAAPIQFNPAAPYQLGGQTYAMSFAILDGVVEVIDCGDNWRSWNN